MTKLAVSDDDALEPVLSDSLARAIQLLDTQDAGQRNKVRGLLELILHISFPLSIFTQFPYLMLLFSP